jgi:hypothetical protein
MKTLIRILILAALAVWLGYFGGWQKLCAGINYLQAARQTPQRSDVARGVSHSFKRQDDLSNLIKKGGEGEP